MLHDFCDYDDGTRIETDLCIIGAGPAGLAIAREFIGTSIKVVLVESGGLKYETSTETLNQGESIGIFYNNFSSEGRSRVFGGTSHLWFGQCIPMDEMDFEARAWVPYSGWPIKRSDLDLYYQRAESFLGIRGETYDEEVFQRFNLQPPPLDTHKVEYQPTVWCPRPHIGKLYRRSFKTASNITVLLHATAIKLHSNDTRTQVDYLAICTLDGKKGQIRAKTFVLCCGGIENARLLLLSENLGNDYDVVGRFFQEHLHALCGAIQTTSPATLQESLALLYKRRIRYLPKIHLTSNLQYEQKVLNCTSNLVFQYSETSAMSAARDIYLSIKQGQLPKNWLQNTSIMLKDVSNLISLLHRRYCLGRSPLAQPSSIWLQIHSEQTPNPDSRILLTKQRDALGCSQVSVDWRLTELDRRTAEVMTKTMQTVWATLNVAQVEPVSWLTEDFDHWSSRFSTSCHHIGTTRMADNPRYGVVDRNCQVHGTKNLFIAGSSVFPTGGYANPTLTLVALAIRLSDYLKNWVSVT